MDDINNGHGNVPEGKQNGNATSTTKVKRIGRPPKKARHDVNVLNEAANKVISKAASAQRKRREREAREKEAKETAFRGEETPSRSGKRQANAIDNQQPLSDITLSRENNTGEVIRAEGPIMRTPVPMDIARKGKEKLFVSRKRKEKLSEQQSVQAFLLRNRNVGIVIREGGQTENGFSNNDIPSLCSNISGKENRRPWQAVSEEKARKLKVECQALWKWYCANNVIQRLFILCMHRYEHSLQCDESEL